MGGSGGGASVPGVGGGLGPFCPVSLAASVRGEGTLSVSELLLTAAAGGEQRKVSSVGCPREEVDAAPSPTARPDSGQELRMPWPRQLTPNSSEVSVKCPGGSLLLGHRYWRPNRRVELGAVSSEEPGGGSHADCTPTCLPWDW